MCETNLSGDPALDALLIGIVVVLVFYLALIQAARKSGHW